MHSPNGGQSDLKTLLLSICQLHHSSPSSEPAPPFAMQYYNQYIQKLIQPNNANDAGSKFYQIEESLMIFLRNVTEIDIDWIDLLVNDGISSETETITINRPSTLTKLYQGLMRRVEQQTADKIKQSFGNQQCKTFQQLHVDQTCLALIAQIFNTFAQAIAACFQFGKSIIAKNAEQIDEKIKTSQCINSYIVFAMLKQMATETEKLITQRIDKVFPNLPLAKRSSFCKYIQKNYQMASLVCIESGKNYIYTRAEMVKYQQQKNKKWLKFMHDYLFCNDIKLSKIESVNGQNGILLQRKSSTFKHQDTIEMQKIEQEGQNSTSQENTDEQGSGQKTQNEKFILKIEEGKEIKIINAKVCQQSWRIFDSQQSMTELYDTFEKQIETTGKKKKNDYISYGVPTCEFATIGGSLGKCLADINKYHSANQFFVELSKDAAICSAFSAAMTEVPILSYFIIAGGLSYSYYMACKNKATSSERKANQIGSATLTAFMSIGSTVGGILLGQTIIPVPFVGAFFGGVAGAFLGTKGARHINEVFSKASFQETISYMKAKVVEDSHWEATEFMLDRVGLDRKYFDGHTPGDQGSKDVFITAICFCIVTFYESKRYMDFNDRKIKQTKEKQNQEMKLNYDGQQPRKNQELQVDQNLQNDAEEDRFQNEFNLVAIVDYLSREQFSILQQLDALANFIVHIVK